MRPPLLEVPVGFKWFAPGLLDGSVCFGGEESAGASFLRRDGTVWTTDKDGLDPRAARGRDHRAHRQGSRASTIASSRRSSALPHYTRIDAPATPEQKARLAKLSPEAVRASSLAGEPITAKLTRAPGNDAPIGGLKVVDGRTAGSPRGRPAPRISTRSTRRACRDERHLQTLVAEAQQIVAESLRSS